MLKFLLLAEYSVGTVKSRIDRKVPDLKLRCSQAASWTYNSKGRKWSVSLKAGADAD